MHDVSKQAYDRRLMRRVLAYVRPYWREIAIGCLGILFGTAAAVAQPYLMKVAIDGSIASRRLDDLYWVALVYVGVLIAAFGAGNVQTWAMHLTGQRVVFDLRMAMYRHLQRIDLAYYDRQPVGLLMTRVTVDVSALSELFTSGAITIVADFVTLVGIAAVMAWMNWRLALVAFAAWPLIAAVTRWFRRSVRETFRLLRSAFARVNASLHENMTGMSTVQLFRREALNLSRFDEMHRQHRDLSLRSDFYFAMLSPAIDAVAALSSALILWYGGRRVLESTLSLGALVAFLQYSQRFFRPINEMAEKFNVLQSALVSAERIFELLDQPVGIESPARPIARPMWRQTGHIRFDRVWFAYANRPDASPAWVLRDISFEVEPSQRVGIVGATGSGKTTLINLLLRFYDVGKGRIAIDGVDLRRWDLVDLRSLFAVVLQDAYVCAGTIAENIRLGERGITDERVRRAARAVGADRFIERLPRGYDTPIAARGATLSAGQRQLLSLARALAFDPRVLVLDEATSSVDSGTERQIRHALSTVMAGRTTIAIAHRISTVQDMDTILVIHKGVLRESGTHRELLARRGIYYRLFELQSVDRHATAGGRGWRDASRASGMGART